MNFQAELVFHNMKHAFYGFINISYVKISTLKVGMSFCLQQLRCIFFKLTASSRDSIRCMMDGINEKEQIILIDIGDIKITHSSGGSSTVVLLNSAITEQAELFSIKPIRLLCKYNTKANFTKSKISYNSEEEQRHFLFFF